jgi:hypothetical protein
MSDASSSVAQEDIQMVAIALSRSIAHGTGRGLPLMRGAVAPKPAAVGVAITGAIAVIGLRGTARQAVISAAAASLGQLALIWVQEMTDSRRPRRDGIAAAFARARSELARDEERRAVMVDIPAPRRAGGRDDDVRVGAGGGVAVPEHERGGGVPEVSLGVGIRNAVARGWLMPNGIGPRRMLLFTREELYRFAADRAARYAAPLLARRQRRKRAALAGVLRLVPPASGQGSIDLDGLWWGPAAESLPISTKAAWLRKRKRPQLLERDTGVEPATFSLGIEKDTE